MHKLLSERNKMRSMKRTNLILAALIWINSAFFVLAAPTTTTLKPSVNQTTTSKLIAESRANFETETVTIAPQQQQDKDNDGRRSAYINNQYVADEEIDVNVEQNQPIYEVLQKQMEHVLAAELPTYSGGIQRPPNKPNFDNIHEIDDDGENEYTDDVAAAADETDDSDEELETNYTENTDELTEDESIGNGGYQIVTTSNNYRPTITTTTTRRTTPRPRPTTTTTKATTTTTTTYRTKPTKRKQQHTIISIRTTRSPYHKVSVAPSNSYGKPSILPSNSYGIPSIPPPSTTKPTTKTTTPTTTTTTTTTTTSTTTTPRPTTTAVTQNAYTNPMQNTNYNNYKPRNTFRTISTGSQIVHSPIGELLIKFSVGFAKPPHGMAQYMYTRSAASVDDAIRAISDDVTKQTDSKKQQRRVRKSQSE